MLKFIQEHVVADRAASIPVEEFSEHFNAWLLTAGEGIPKRRWSTNQVGRSRHALGYFSARGADETGRPCRVIAGYRWADGKVYVPPPASTVVEKLRISPAPMARFVASALEPSTGGLISEDEFRRKFIEATGQWWSPSMVRKMAKRASLKVRYGAVEGYRWAAS